MFAIYFSVVSSLSEEECMETLGCEKNSLLRIYKFPTEQALAQARLLETEEMIVLQAFVIFLASLRNYCSIRLMWTLTALAARLARNAGIHRDGTHFNLPPFVVEMRRRLWWSICVLDCRASEDSGYDAAIPYAGVDTQLPLNVNDADLLPNMTGFPEHRTGLTDMTFSVIRFEATKTFRHVQYMPATPSEKNQKVYTVETLVAKQELITKHCERVRELIEGCDLSNPFCWYTDVVSKIVLMKLRLITYHLYLHRQDRAEISENTRNDLFVSSISIVESWLLINTDPRSRQWRWLSKTYVQWYAITFILSELCVRTHGDLVERAWEAIYGALQLGSKAPSVSDKIWNNKVELYLNLNKTHDEAYKPLIRLLRKAHLARSSALSVNQSSAHGRSGANTRPAESNSFSGPSFELYSQDLHSIASNNSSFVEQSFMADTFASEQAPGNGQEYSYDRAIHNSPYPQTDLATSNWANWQDFLK